jgi:hypothetical protein
MIGEGDCGAIGEMKIGRGNRSTRRKPQKGMRLSYPELRDAITFPATSCVSQIQKLQKSEGE